MCPASKPTDQRAGVTISGSVGRVAGDIIGGNKIIHGLDEYRVVDIVLRILQSAEQANGGFISRRAPLPPRRAVSSASQDFSESGRDLILGLREALSEIVDLISDLDDNREIALANNRLSEWKRKTDRIVNSFFESGNLDYEIKLYNIMPDTNQRTPFNKIKNEARKCQRIIMDILLEIEGH